MTSYKLKYVSFFGREVPVVMQNENGPCPLLAIVNVLLLRNAIHLPELPEVEQDRLLTVIADYLFEHNPIDPKSEFAGDLQENLNGVIASMPKLTTGVDVNPKFNSVRGFEFTNEIAIFDLFDISLVHGWIVDPQETTVSNAMADLTYNQVVAKLISKLGSSSLKGGISVEEEPPLIDLEGPSQTPPLVFCELVAEEAGVKLEMYLEKEKNLESEECKVVENWLTCHSSQLSAYGLFELHNHMRENELAVFFRNNHFNTIFKKESALYILVTDQGYLSEASLVWEQLGSVNNDNTFYTGEFTLYEAKREEEKQAMDNDQQLQYALALSLQEGHELETQQHPGILPSGFLQASSAPEPSLNADADLAYALSLQEEEDMKAEERQHQRNWSGYQNQGGYNLRRPHGGSQTLSPRRRSLSTAQDPYLPMSTTQQALPDHSQTRPAQEAQTLQERHPENASRGNKILTKLKSFLGLS